MVPNLRRNCSWCRVVPANTRRNHGLVTWVYRQTRHKGLRALMGRCIPLPRRCRWGTSHRIHAVIMTILRRAALLGRIHALFVHHHTLLRKLRGVVVRGSVL
jgi:hypothetical protein